MSDKEQQDFSRQGWERSFPPVRVEDTIRPRRPREGWADGAKRMHDDGKDKVLDHADLIQNEFDAQWVWPDEPPQGD